MENRRAFSTSVLSWLPRSMRGTPTLTLFDTEGCIRQHYFGKVSYLALRAEIALLLAEAAERG